MKLTPKQLKFADEYVKTGNATQSAIKAGYAKKAAYQTGAENLKKPQIKSYIEKKLAEIESHKIADAKEVLQFFTRVLRGEVSETVITPDGDKVEKEPDVKTRMNAGKEIMKRYPNDSPIVKAQLRRLEAEAALKEHERKQLEEQTNSRTTIVINDEWEDDDGKND
ncbi:terminase small subunit [Ligilactobacillus equi]|uniref:Terminase small subunit n=1 Tax=Ligilactobacillus equi DPC 6820 TaxID=1392007 RepID=V7I0U9_9LACO|nr:terminase small subunit [Ligilactobacillus equi]ETA75083.1 terminase small subunit [Ligilactobacillus equi DPC 6820]